MRLASAVFAGGDFRGLEADFDKIGGVIETVNGYVGGSEDHPSHKAVISGETGHYEAVKVTYDPSRVSYDELASQFLRVVDPTDDAGQFCDRGDSFRTAIFVSGVTERNAAVASVSNAQRVLGKDVVTEIRPLTAFWAAEDQYQDYHVRHASRYTRLREECGRDVRIQQVWGKATPAL